jgi:hypothetical protein
VFEAFQDAPGFFGRPIIKSFFIQGLELTGKAQAIFNN